jgi:hypothetical protein
MMGTKSATIVCAQANSIPAGEVTAGRRVPGVDRFLAEEMPELEPDDAQMHLDLYKNGDPEEDLRHFQDQRETNIELLRDLPADVGSRKAKPRTAGEITLSQMLHEWALHDLGHVRQIAELVRARVRWGRTIS